MSAAKQCPDAACLAEHLAGALSAADDGRVTAHLDTCETCQETLEILATDDAGLSRAARRAGERPTESGPGLQAALERLVRDDEGPWRATRVGAHELAFLTPSETSGELGRLGHYTVTAVLGRGGMGIVLAAFDEKLHRNVAIKALAPHWASDPHARKRFIREARAAAAVRHENLVTIYAVEEAGDVPYLVMEHIAGESLQDRIDRGEPIDFREIARIGAQTARGLAAAHEQGLIHRDIKPANILLEAGSGRVKITDFGLARSVDDAGVTRSGVVAGTPQYMAPEQARGKALDPRADLFSLASVLYVLCAGRQPFEADGTLAVLRRIADESPRPVGEVNPLVPEWLAEVIGKLHAKAPGNRFQSAAEVAEVLERGLAGVDERHTQVRQSRRAGTPPTVSKGWAVAAACVLIAGLAAAIFQAFGPPGSSDGQFVAIESYALVGHGGPVWSVAFTPDGGRILSAGGDARVRVWDVATRRQLQRFTRHTGTVFCVAISPDGRRALSGSGELPGSQEIPAKTIGSVCLWEIESGTEIHRLDGEEDAITSVSFSPDGKQALFGSFRGAVVLWDVENWKEISRWRTESGLWSVRFSPDAKQAVTAGGDRLSQAHVRTWDLPRGTERKRFGGHTAGCWQAVFTPDGRQVLTTSADGTMRLYDAQSGSEVRRFRGEHFTSVAISADGKFAVSGNYGTEKTVRMWRLGGDDELGTLEGHTQGVQSVAISSDGRWAASGSHDQTVRLWRLPSNVRQEQVSRK
jgi:hypothetical protein